MILGLLALGCFACGAAAGATPAAREAVRPALVLLVVVDQLRGDMPWRFAGRFGAGGFRYLMDNGVVYRNAQYQHANTMTATGHATLMTGANAAQHGIVANDWYDVEQGRKVYSLEDSAAEVLGAWTDGGEVPGRSPRNLAASTFGDELFTASGGRSRVFSVSLKDRSAIAMGGHLGKAFWYSKADGRFVTSRYYYAAMPDWMRAWNAGMAADRYRSARWDLLEPRDRYVFADRDDRPYEQFDGNLGRVFPHPLANDDPAVYYDSLRSSPMADELTLDFVEALVEAERPGRGGATDVLAVSFSATDYIGHDYGPYSLEAEDNLLRLDRTLAALLQRIDETVGLERTLVVLVSDHGMAPAPEFAVEQGFSAGRLDMPRIVPALDSALKARFRASESLIAGFWKPYLYLDSAAVERAGASLEAVEQALAVEAAKVEGIRYAFARSDLLAGRYPDNPDARRVMTALHPRRSGNVALVADTWWYLSERPADNAATHGTPHRYDTHVPLMFAGAGLAPRTVWREVAPRDLAPTLSARLGISPPSDATGEPLREVLD